MLRNKTDPLQDTVIMPADGSTYGRGVESMHTDRTTAKKTKAKKNPNKRCIYMMSLLHCTLEGVGGFSSNQDPPSVNQGQNPAGNSATQTRGLSSLWSSLVTAPRSSVPGRVISTFRERVQLPWVLQRIQAKNSGKIFLCK